MLHVFVPAATNANGQLILMGTPSKGGKQGTWSDEESRNAWAILRGSTNPPTVVAFCWDREIADEIYKAMNAAAGERVCWISPAILSEHDPR